MNKFDIYLIRNDVKEEPYISSIVNQLYHKKNILIALFLQIPIITTMPNIFMSSKIWLT